MELKYIIVSPRNSSGGAKVLLNLYNIMDDLGLDVQMCLLDKVPTYKKNYFGYMFKFYLWTFVDVIKDKIQYSKMANDDYKNVRKKRVPILDKNTIVIYPDVVYGNPLNGEKNIRYLLYYNRFSNDAYSERDMFVCYRQQFNDIALNPNGLELCIPYFDLNLYRRENYGKREGTCYIIRKGKNRTDIPQIDEKLIIDNWPEDEKVKMFNSCEYCVSYDTETAYSTIAALCGCISIVMPEKGKTRSDYIKPNENKYGVAYGLEEKELLYAKETSNLIYDNILRGNQRGKQKVKEFIKIVNDYFDNEIAIGKE